MPPGQPSAVDFAEFVETDHVKCNAYGIGGAGKTTTVTTVPDEWGTGVYIASDVTSPRLRSVPLETRKRIFRIVPTGYTQYKRDQPNYKGEDGDTIIMTSWKEEAYDFSQRDWPRWLKKQADAIQDKEKSIAAAAAAERIGWYVWDGMTGTGDELLREFAKKHYFTKEGGPTAGPKATEIDYGRKWAQPDKGDFQMVQATCNELIEHWHDQPGHTIITYQESVQLAEAAKQRYLLFGPCTVGQAGPRQVPNRADINLYLTRERDDRNPHGHILVQLVQSDNHVAGIKSNNVPVAIKETHKLLDPNPETTKNFWRWIQKLGKGD